MKIYTKTGDQGMTSLLSGLRVKKTDLQIEAFGAIDELNALLGFIRAQTEEKIKDKKKVKKNSPLKTSPLETNLKKYQEILKYLLEIQNQLFQIGSHLASDKETIRKRLKPFHFLKIKQMENLIDEQEKILPQLKNFILPGGSLISASFHLARTITRRAERIVFHLNEKKEVDSFILQYLNRLSDLLFVLARLFNHLEGKSDVLWKQENLSK